MGACDYGACKGDENLPHTCNECGGTYCSEHRLPEAHNCHALRSKSSDGWFGGISSRDNHQRSTNTTQSGSASSGESEPMSDEDLQDNKTPSESDSSEAISTPTERCLECGRATIRECEECGGTYCKRHKSPRLHNCAFLEDSPGSAETPPRPQMESTESDTDSRGVVGSILSIIFLPFVLAYSVLSWMRSRWKLCVVLIAAIGIAGLGATGELNGVLDESGAVASDIGNATDNSLNESRVEILVHEGINNERANYSRSQLDHDPTLRRIASNYSQRMATEGFYGHMDPQGQTFEDRYANAGYSCRVPISSTRYATGAENILYTYAFTNVRTDNGLEEYHTERELADAIVQSWMNSEGHRENILRSYWQNEGIGVAIIDNPDGDGKKVYATQNFC